MSVVRPWGPCKTKPICGPEALRLRIADFGLRIAERPAGNDGRRHPCRTWPVSGANRAKRTQFRPGQTLHARREEDPGPTGRGVFRFGAIGVWVCRAHPRPSESDCPSRRWPQSAKLKRANRAEQTQFVKGRNERKPVSLKRL